MRSSLRLSVAICRTRVDQGHGVDTKDRSLPTADWQRLLDGSGLGVCGDVRGDLWS